MSSSISTNSISTNSSSKNRWLSGALLVAGTSIGGGMLGLPVATSPGGFFPALLWLFLSWWFMTSTGVVLVELCCNNKDGAKEGANLVTLAEARLGRIGKVVAWSFSLFLFTTLIVAYLVALSQMVERALGIGDALPFGALPFITLLASAILWPKFKLLFKINNLMMLALLSSYFLFIVVGLPYIQGKLLLRASWVESYWALPILFTSFGFQGTVPSLCKMLHYDHKVLKKSVIIGTTLTFTIYLLWQLVLLGSVPYEGGLELALQQGQDAVAPLVNLLNAPMLSLFGQIFAFTAVTTSLLGVARGLLDFLADGLGKNSDKPADALQLLLLIFLPTSIIALYNPTIFLQALGVAGGLGCAVLLGLLPLLMSPKVGIMRVLLYTFVIFEILLELKSIL